MNTLNNSYHLLYKQALIDPLQLTEEDILALLLKYPYSQPLIFAYERRKKLVNEESSNKELALLYANNERWLYGYINKPVDVIEELKPEQEEYIPFEELESIAESEEEIENESVDSSQLDANDQDVENNLVNENLASADSELDKLVQGGSVLGDYFVFESFEKIDASESEPVEEKVILQAAEEKEDISLYNDDLMPYSFRWWLHKTRLEHADTYQPYLPQNYAIAPSKKVDYSKGSDVSILDQQIKENIINFQDPEEKLSEEVKKRPVIPAPPKKSSEIIEKFIQKDPIIQPPSPQSLNNENMARQSAEDNYVLVTETLANIYVDQGLYLKAIEVLKKLILKYPEKKSYFAIRIQELEKNL